MAKPLAGVRIADFTVHNAGPFCTHLLSQLGAEVIKIESAMRPDAFRKPHPVYGRMGPATFDQVASNKLSVRLNLKKTEGVDLARRIVAISDIAAESFRPGVMSRLGLSYESLLSVNERLVMVSISSSGQDGPDSHFAGYAPLFGAWGGLGELTGYADGPPVEIRHVMDHTVGMHAAVATVAALHKCKTKGETVFVDVAARDVASALIGDALLATAAGENVTRSGNTHETMAPHGVYPAAGDDRWISIAVTSDEDWGAMARVIGHEELRDDPRFATAAARVSNRDALEDVVTGWTVSLPANYASAQLQAAGTAAHASWTTPEIVNDSHLRAREAIVDVPETDGRTRAAVSVPMRMSKGADIGFERGTPALGEHEDYVFGELLALTRRERTALEEAEVIY